MNEEVVDKKEGISQIKTGSVAKRALAFIMDLVVFAFTAGLLASCVMSPIANVAFKQQEKESQLFEYRLTSELFIVTSTVEDVVTYVDETNYKSNIANIKEYFLYDYSNEDKEEELQTYKDRLTYYFTCYRVGENLVYPIGSPDPKTTVTYKEKEYSSADFVDTFIKNETDKSKLVEIAKFAINDFGGFDYYTSVQSELNLIRLFVFGPSIVVSYFVFLFLIPLCFKNGETLGKKVTHLAFVNKDGYDVKKRQIIMRQLVIFAYGGVLLYSSIGLFCLGGFVYFIVIFFNKEHRSFADMLAYTTLVDVNKSVWFSSKEDEEINSENLDKKMKVYKSRKVENKNLIQIGTKVIK